ncbi:MAG: TIR domain-containing protein [Candidatus Kapabacteria bacterium]|jgi:hypothetical protein|nr:TIR domain-containing protein [Candidatus Kapabacteria bacterium]
MAKKVFVSFDYENDKHYKHLLQAWDANDGFEFSFDDRSSGEINSDSIPVVKAALTKKIKDAKITLVIVGKEANKRHKDYKEIGYKNWINFEIAQSKVNGKKLLAVKLDKEYESPEALINSGASWVIGFEHDKIVEALRKL